MINFTRVDLTPFLICYSRSETLYKKQKDAYRKVHGKRADYPGRFPVEDQLLDVLYTKVDVLTGVPPPATPKQGVLRITKVQGVK